MRPISVLKMSTRRCAQFISVVPSYLTGVLLVFVLELQLEKETLLFERTERAR